MNAKSILLTAGATTACILFAAPNGDRPDATHAWAVHDENRPNAPVVSAEEGQVPSDAIVLFDGTQKSVDDHWCDSGGKPTKWVARDGLLYCVPNSGMAYAKDEIGDCQMHVEFMIPDPPGGGFGNSGVYLHGRYEIQIIHSVGNTDEYSPVPPWKHANYADGQLGAFYGQNPPIVNPARAAGKWQSLDVVFHPAHWEGDALVEPATATVFLNGVLIQDNFALEGPTYYCERTRHHKSEKPINRALALQDHGNPVPFRNIWIRPIPSRRANTVQTGPAFRAEDAEKLREKLAAETLAKAHASDVPASRLVWLWESYAYRPDVAVKAEIEAYTKVYVERISAWKKPATSEQRRELSNMKGFRKMGLRCGLFGEDDPLPKAIAAAAKVQEEK